jgi:hypothetical protein
MFVKLYGVLNIWLKQFREQALTLQLSEARLAEHPHSKCLAEAISKSYGIWHDSILSAVDYVTGKTKSG